MLNVGRTKLKSTPTEKDFQSDLASLGRLTVSDLLERFRDTVAPKRRHRVTEVIVINAFLRHRVASVRLSNLTPNHFAEYRDERLKEVKPGTINRQLGLIQHIFEVARVEWNVPLAANPIKAIRKPKADRSRDRRLQTGEWERLLEASQSCRNALILPLVRFARETGMRRGELLNACWKDVNWPDSTLRIPITKNGEPRTIPLSTEATGILNGLGSDRPDEARIFPLTEQSVSLAWKRLVRRAKIENLHFHDLRHEAISRFFEKGLTVPEVALISGHKDPRMLFRYTHLRAEDVARKLNSMKEGTLGQ